MTWRDPLTIEELAQLALGITAGQVWTDRSCETPFDLATMFMPVALMSATDRAELVAFVEPTPDGVPGLIYEWGHKALSSGVNNRPTFGSLRVLSGEQVTELDKIIHRIENSLGHEEE
jgi:hypothetical protein